MLPKDHSVKSVCFFADASKLTTDFLNEFQRFFRCPKDIVKIHWGTPTKIQEVVIVQLR